MGIRLEITGETPFEIAAHLDAFFKLMPKPGKAEKPAATIDAKAEAKGEPKEEKPKRGRGRPPKTEKKAEEKAEAPKDDDAPEKSDDTASQDESGGSDGSDDELTKEQVRDAMIAYTNAAAAKSEEEDGRRIAFKELLDAFKVKKLTELPEDKYGEMVELANTKLAELED